MIRLLCGLLLIVAAVAQTVPVANPSFEEGEAMPTDWTLTGGQGRWISADGRRVLEVTGTGDDSGEWHSAPVALLPGAVYRLGLRARSVGQSGGTPTCGFPFANEDLGDIAGEWKPYRFVFAVPGDVDTSYLRLGQWHVSGSIQYDEVELCRAEPIHRRQGELVLGEGESIDGQAYRFEAPLTGAPGNQSRPLARHTAGFNSNRWVFGPGGEVVYRHEVAGRRQTAARVEVNVGWYAGGRLVVEAGTDGESWRLLGRLDGTGQVAADLPAALLPAETVWVRLRAEARETAGGLNDPGSFQVHGYGYQAELDGPPVELRGATQYAVVREIDQGFAVSIAGLGELLPGGDNRLTVAVDNLAGEPATVRPVARVSRDGRVVAETTADEQRLGAGRTELTVPYQVPGTGAQALEVSLGGGLGWRAEIDFHVADLYAADYGERLPGGDELGLWWCSSGWKVSRPRPRPTEAGEALRIAAARGEAEAAQLVLRPVAPVRGLTATALDLRGPGGAVLPAAAVEVLRVGYVEVTRPTDFFGVAGWWPDPLPPFGGPIDLAGSENQPLWVRVTVPREQPAGVYRGAVRLSHAGGTVQAPIAVEVFDFTLPESMTCETAFGFDPGLVWRYHGLETEAQRREVLERYWQSFASHHIAPYNPAPLDPFRVTWPTADEWSAGERDTEEVFAGEASLRLADDSETAGAGAGHPALLAIPPGGLKLEFQHLAAAGHEFIVTFNHLDAAGEWMSGRNNDMVVRGTGEWTRFERTVTEFPPGAAQVRLTLWPCLYSEEGATTGTVRFDEVRVSEAAGGAVLLESGFEPLAPAQLAPTIDWTAWDAAMTRAMDEHHFSTYAVPVPGLGGGTFHSRSEPSLLGYGEETPQYQAALAAYLRQVEAHLAERGWLDKAFVYWFDEPDPKDYEFVMNGFRKLREFAPGIRRMLTEQVETELVGGPNLWCPVSPAFDLEAATGRRAAGEEFWWYVCTGPKAPFATLFIDHPGTELRVWLWQTWQRGIDGILVWQTNYWTSGAAYPDAPQNPYADPMGWVSGYSTPAGTRAAWGNGDGRFIYPPEAAADANSAAPVLDGPVDSIRWEMLRDGIEDYEYLAMLRALQPDHELLSVPPEITSDMTTFTTDPRVIEARRERIARAIEQLVRR